MARPSFRVTPRGALPGHTHSDQDPRRESTLQSAMRRDILKVSEGAHWWTSVADESGINASGSCDVETWRDSGWPLRTRFARDPVDRVDPAGVRDREVLDRQAAGRLPSAKSERRFQVIVRDMQTL